MTTSVCILRLSSLGDVTNVVPVIRRLQQAWPGVRLTWIIGKLEWRLLRGIEGVEFIPFDKRGGIEAVAGLRRALRGRRFDVLLHMQRSLRANLLSSFVRADRRIGFDRLRSAELHSLFITERIAWRPGQHLLDAFLGFLDPLGIPSAPPVWNLPVSDDARDFARSEVPEGPPVLLISPASSHPARVWSAEGYARVADHAVIQRGFRVALCGGPTPAERELGNNILALMRAPAIDLIGRDTLERFLALLERSRVVLSPDSGPLHMANAMGVSVVGLHAATPAWTSGPYSNRRFCVDRYDAAAMKYRGLSAAALPWGARLHEPGVMDLIQADEVIEAFDRCTGG